MTDLCSSGEPFGEQGSPKGGWVELAARRLDWTVSSGSEALLSFEGFF